MRLQTLSLPCSCCLTPPICSTVLTGIGELGEISTSSPHSFFVYFIVIGWFLQILIIVPIRFSIFFYLIGGFFLFAIFHPKQTNIEACSWVIFDYFQNYPQYSYKHKCFDWNEMRIHPFFTPCRAWQPRFACLSRGLTPYRNKEKSPNASKLASDFSLYFCTAYRLRVNYSIIVATRLLISQLVLF